MVRVGRDLSGVVALKTVVKNVFYCDYCRRHRLVRRSIEDHEPRCIYNPERSCGWSLYGAAHPTVSVGELAAEIVEKGVDWLDWLRKETSGCPACMLAAVAQARRRVRDEPHHEGWSDCDFDYDVEVKRFREEENRAMAGDLW